MDARAGYGVGALSGTARIRLRRLALPAVCAFLGALVALLVGLITTPSGDAPSHLFQTWLFSNGGFEVWNNYWYAGRYEFVTYSVFYYPLAAQVGQLAVLVPAAGLLCGSFARAAQVEWGRRAVRGPAMAFAVTAPFVMLVGGLYPFLVATACGAMSLVLLQQGWRLAFTASVFATLAFSPLAFAVLAALLAGVALGQRQPLSTLRTHRYAFAAILGVFLAGVFMQRAFPTQAWYPYDLTDAAIVLGFSLAGLYITGASPRARSLRMLFAVYLSLNLFAFLLAEPDRLQRDQAVRDRRRPHAVAGRQHQPPPLAADRGAAAGGGDGAAGRPLGQGRLLGLEQPGRQGLLLAAGDRVPAQPSRLGIPGRGRRYLGPLGRLLPGPAAGAAGPRLVPAGRLPAERGALDRTR